MLKPWTEIDTGSVTLMTTAVVSGTSRAQRHVLRVYEGVSGFGVAIGDIARARVIGENKNLAVLMISLNEYLKEGLSLSEARNTDPSRSNKAARHRFEFSDLMEMATPQVMLAECGLRIKPLTLFRMSVHNAPMSIALDDGYEVRYGAEHDEVPICKSADLSSILMAIDNVLIAATTTEQIRAMSCLPQHLAEIEHCRKLEHITP